MQLSAEIRWFWTAHDFPRNLEEWFCAATNHGGVTAGGGIESREDRYVALPGQEELGIKRRNVDKNPSSRRVEIKGLVAASVSELAASPFNGPVELWTKWGAEIDVSTAELIPIRKTRWLRKFVTATPYEVRLGPDEKPIGASLPEFGCNVELTKIELADGAGWWSFGFESFGSLTTIESSLTAVAGLLKRRTVPTFERARRASYPAWLNALP